MWRRDFGLAILLLGPHNPNMRRIMSLALALCLTLGGAAAVLYLLAFSPGWKGVVSAALVTTIGALWLWYDFYRRSSEWK